MRITKYPQSTLLIGENGTRILIDPGSFTLEKYPVDHFGALNAVLITHQHFDHLYIPAIKAWYDLGVRIFGNRDVAEVLKREGLEIDKVANRISFKINNIELTPIDLPHCRMIDGSPGPPNTGFIINGIFFHPGDGIEPAGEKVDNAAIPIAGPTIDYNKAWKLAESLEAKKIIPIHYSNPKYDADPNIFASSKKGDIEVIVLKDGDFTEI